MRLTESYHFQYPVLLFAYIISLFALRNSGIDRELSYLHDCIFLDDDWPFRALEKAESKI